MEKKDIQQRLYSAIQYSQYKENVRRISLFGSQLHGDATVDSDVDLLVEFKKPMTMLSIVHMERDLAEALGRKVDLCTPNSLSKYFRDDVVNEAEALFEVAT